MENEVSTEVLDINISVERVNDVARLVADAVPMNPDGSMNYRLMPRDRLLEFTCSIAYPLEALVVDVNQVMEAHKDLAISSVSDYELWTGASARCKGLAQSLDKERKKATDPLRIAASNIKEQFDRPIERLNELVSKIEQAAQRWVMVQEAAKLRQEEEARKNQQAITEEIATHIAARQEQVGQKELAQQTLELAIRHQPIVQSRISVPKIRGVTIKRDELKYEIRDPHELVNRCKTALSEALTIAEAPETDPELRDCLLLTKGLFERFSDLLTLDAERVKERVEALGVRAGIPGVDCWIAGPEVKTRARRG